MGSTSSVLFRSVTHLNFLPLCGKFFREDIIVLEDEGCELGFHDGVYCNRQENSDSPRFSAAKWHVFEGSHELLLKLKTGCIGIRLHAQCGN